MADLDKLIVRIEADLKNLKKGMNDAQRTVKKGSKGMKGGLDDLKKSFLDLGSKTLKYGAIVGGVFGAIQIKKIVDVGSQVENLTVRLNALFGSAEEGAKAFEVMLDFASKVPFELSEIQQSAGNLAVVTDNAQELAEILEITGNVASITGLSFRQTAEQIQRSFSGGIASADMFREKGVRNMLGFSAGAEVSLAETKKAFKETFGKGGEFGNATDEFAQTLTGTLSMLQDKLFAFRLAISEEFFAKIKETFKELNKTLEENQQKIKQFGQEIGEGLANAVQFMIDNLDELLFTLKALGIFLATASGLAILKFFSKLKNIMLLVASAIVIIIAQTVGLEKAMKNTQEAILGMNKMIAENMKTTKAWAMIQEFYIDKFKSVQDENKKGTGSFEDLKQMVEEINKTFEKAGKSISDAFGDSIASGQKFGDSMKSIFQSVISQIISTIVHIKLVKPLIDSLTDSLNNQVDAQKKANDSSGGSTGFSLGNVVGSAIGSMLGFSKGGFTGGSNPIVVGEKGAEVFVPRTAGNIVSNSSLSSGGSDIIINQSLNFATGVVPTVRAEVMNLMPQIKQETVGAVAEARSRGGAFSRTFGA